MAASAAWVMPFVRVGVPFSPRHHHRNPDHRDNDHDEDHGRGIRHQPHRRYEPVLILAARLEAMQPAEIWHRGGGRLRCLR